VALLGAGRVGTAVSAMLRRRGHQIVAVVSRSEASARRAADRLGSSVRPLDEARFDDVDLVLIGTSDTAIAGAAELVAESIDPDSVVCHFAGAYGIDPLRAVVKPGAGACALHPVQAFPDVDTAIARLPGSAWGVTCSHGLEAWAEELITEDLDGLPVSVAEADRPLWHAASVVTGNGISALLATGESILESIGVSRPELVLGPLAAGVVDNARSGGGGAQTLTGPVVRGDAATLTRHIDALATHAPHHLGSYLLATRLVLDAARRGAASDGPQNRPETA
jgi:predicted short-subunit dehydrogenase-like oxidoreductase (DUF2520 family)